MQNYEKNRDYTIKKRKTLFFPMFFRNFAQTLRILSFQKNEVRSCLVA